MLLCVVLVFPFVGEADAPDGNQGEKSASAEPGAVLPPVADSGAGEAAEEMTDVVDIRPPVSFGWDPRWKFLAAAIGVLALAALMLILWKRRRRSVSKPEGPPPEPEDRIAFRDLADLSAEDSCSDREYYFRLSGILRAYLDRRFELDTLERTADELIPVLKKLEADRPDRTALLDLFRFADPVKFAGIPAGETRRRNDLIFARAFVEKTRRGGNSGV